MYNRTVQYRGQRQVRHGEVEDEEEDRLGVVRVEDGGQGGEEDQEVEQRLGYELEDGHSVETGSHQVTRQYQPFWPIRLRDAVKIIPSYLVTLSLLPLTSLG